MGGTSDPLGAAFDAARTRDGGFQMTEDEQKSFVKAMKDPEFRALLNEYMLEISDPQNRAEQEMYLRQLERENQVPADKQLVLPKAGFVLKVKHKGKKMFVNVCTSDKIQPPSSTRVEQSASVAAGTSWNLPYCVGPHRMEQDKGGQAVMTFDVCYHPQTLVQAKQSAAFLKMLVNTTLDGVDLALSKIEPNESKVSRDYHILKGIAYKSGDPITMVITTPKEKQVESTSKPSSAPKATSKPPTTSRKEPEANLSKVSKAKSTEAPVDTSLKKPTISYQIVQRGQFDIADHVENGGKKLFRPRELLVKMDFPAQTSAAGIDLDVSSKQVKVSAKDYSPLCIDLPFPVVEAKGSAKFDKATRKLIVTLPVVEEDKPLQKAFIPVEDTEIEDKQEIPEMPPKVKSPKLNTSTSEKKVIEPKQAVPTDEFAPFREFALMSKHDKPKITYKSPKVTIQETSSHISYILQVSGIISDSVSAMEVNDDITRMTFQASDSSWYEYAFPHTGISEWNHDLATANMAIICTKLNSPSKALNDIVHDVPHRVHLDASTISIIVDVANVDSASVHEKFTSSTLAITFQTKENVTYEFHKAFDQLLNPDACKVANVADDNMLIVLTLQEDDGPRETKEEKMTISTQAKAAIINRFTNDVITRSMDSSMSEALDDALAVLASSPWTELAIKQINTSLTLHGTERNVSWPLNEETIAFLRQSNEQDPVVLPASDITLNIDPQCLNNTLERARSALVDIMVPTAHESSIAFKLSHVAVDSTGHLNSLISVNRPNGAFATLVFGLDSEFTGGSIVLTNDRRKQTFTLSKDSLLLFFNSSSIEMSPIESGSLSIVVFHVVFNDFDRYKDNFPPNQHHVVSFLQQIAAVDHLVPAIFCSYLTKDYSEIDFDLLDESDKAIVDGFLASHCFDLALVRTHKVNATYLLDYSGIDQDMLINESASLQISQVVAHEACAIPEEVQAALVDKPLRKFIGSPRYRCTYQKSPTRLVFWPKKHRLRILGFHLAISHLRNVLRDVSKDLLGYDSLHEMVLIVMQFFDRQKYKKDIHWKSEIPDQLEMASFLLEFGDFTLITEFLGKFFVPDTYTDPSIWFLNLFEEYGMEKLHTPMMNFINNLSIKSLGGISRTLDSLSCLVEDNALCLSLRQPYSTQFLMQWWYALIEKAYHLSQVILDESFYQDAQRFLKSAIILESCLSNEAVDPYIGLFLGKRLPISLVHHVDSFLYPKKPFDLAINRKDIFHPANVISPVLMDIRLLELSIPLQPYRELLLSAYPEINCRQANVLSPQAFVSTLCLTQGTPLFENVVSDILCQPNDVIITVCHDLIVKFSLFTDDDIQDLLLQYALDAIKRELESEDGVRGVDYFLQETLRYQEIVVLVYEICEYLNSHDAIDFLLEHVKIRCDQMNNTSTFAHGLLIPLLKKMVKSDFVDSDAIMELADRSIDSLQALMAKTQLPPQPDWSLPNITLPCQCRFCSMVQGFFADANACQLNIKDSELCLHFRPFTWLFNPFPGVDVGASVLGDIILAKESAILFYPQQQLRKAYKFVKKHALPETERATKRQRHDY